MGKFLQIFGWIAFLGAAAAFCQTFSPSETKLLGPIEYGQPSPEVTYTGNPRYVSFRFNAKPGDHLDVTIDGQPGKFQAYLTDAQYRKLAGGEAHFTAAIPSDSEPATYYILVTEADLRPTKFTVDLERPSTSSDSPTPDYLVCSENSDCIAVERAGCCHNGFKDAVNASKVDEYRAANVCKKSGPCPMFRILDKRVAVCNTVKHRCEMVQPAK